MTPTTDSAVSPVREVFAVLMNGNWSIATKALAGSYGLEPSDADVWCEQGTTALIGLVGKEDASIALSRRSLDTADGVALSALKAADALLTAEAENRGDFDEDYEANVGPALAKVRSAITALASPPSPAEVMDMEGAVRALHEALGGNGWAYTNYGNDELHSRRSELEAGVRAIVEALQLNKKG
jgi:hypothetical protein